MTSAVAPRSRREIVVAFSGIMLATLLAALDQTIVATALPRIAADLHSFEHLSWVVTAYLVTSTVTMPLYGKLSDLYGRRPLFVVAISIFLIGSALCGASQSMVQLAIFRGLQGVGAGGLLPLSQAAVADLVSPRERGRYVGLIGSMWALAAIAGPLVGGSLTDAVSWRWIFYINIPLGLVALAVIARTMPLRTERRAHRIDLAGALTLSAAVTALLLASVWGGTTHPWGSPEVIATAVAGLVLTAIFVAIETRAPEPLVPLELFRERVFAIAALASLALGVVAFGLTVYIPVFIQGVLGASATSSGVAVIPFAGGWVIASFVAGQIMARTGRYRAFPIVGSFLVLSALGLLSQVDVDTSRAAIAGIVAVVGVGIGISFQIYMVATQNAVASQQIGTATAGLLFFRTIGATLGIAALGALLNNRVSAELADRLGPASRPTDQDRLLQGGVHGPSALVHAVREALSASLDVVFLALVPAAVVGVVCAFVLPERRLRANH